MVLEQKVAQSVRRLRSVGGRPQGGRKRKTVQVVSQLARPVDGERGRSLQWDVTKVQGLVVGVELELGGRCLTIYGTWG